MTPGVEDRLRAHVAGVVERASIPAAERDGVAEELFGHLADRWVDHVGAGLDDLPAADLAIADFGAQADIGREFQRTYHSRLWASTIGVLLPAAGNPDRLPGVVLWVTRGGYLIALISLIAAGIGLFTLSPVRAVLAGGSLGLGGVIVWLASTALRRGQSWAWTVMAWALLVHSAILFTSFSPPGGGFNLSINGLIAFLLLLRLIANAELLRTWVSRSMSLPPRLAAGIGVTMLAWAIIPFAAPNLPDPTQAAVADIAVAASVDCSLDPESDPGRKMVTVKLDVTWKRVDILPLGIARAGQDWGDSVSLRFADSSWGTGGPQLTDAATGEDLDQNGAWGLTMPAAFTGDRGAIDRYYADGGVDASAMRDGRTARMTFVAYTNDPENADYPYDIDIRYAHRDAFILKTILVCGGRGSLRPEAEVDNASGWDMLTGTPFDP